MHTSVRGYGKLRPRGPVLVTGGGGFIGSHVVRLIAADGLPVRVFELPDARLDHLPRASVQIIRGDVRDEVGLRRAAADCDCIIHLAANPNLFAARPQEFEEINHRGTCHMLAAARQAGVHRVVHVSTESILASVDPNATVNEDAQPRFDDLFGHYLQSKWLAEQAVRQASLKGQSVVIVNPAVPVGPGDRRQGPLTRLISQFVRGHVRGYLPGTINLIDVRDAAAGIWAAAGIEAPTPRLLLSGHNLTFRAFFDRLAALTGVPAPRWQVPYTLALAAAWGEEWVSRHVTGHTPLATVAGVRLTRRSFRFDGRRSRDRLGLTLRPLDQSLRDSLDWLDARAAWPGGRAAQAPLDPG